MANALSSIYNSRKAKLAREMSHSGSGYTPTQEEINTSIDVGLGRKPYDVAYGEKGLYGGMELGRIKDMPVSITDILPADMGANALATLGKLGAAKLGALPFVGLAGHTAWHGTPHIFNKFTKEAIGTGEGAQAYGHGLYLAEHPDVARNYMKSAPISKYLVDDGRSYSAGIHDSYLERMVNGEKPEDLLAEISTQSKNQKYDFKTASLPSFLESFIGKKISRAPYREPSIYKTDIPDEHINKMLDWDKPLSAQHPDVQAAIKNAEWLHATEPNINNMTGANIYNAMARRDGSKIFIGDEAKASDYLSKLGIPGIKYLDGTSRTAGEGTRNFVMFNPDDIRILERNGIPTGQVPWSADKGKNSLIDIMKQDEYK